MPVLTRYLSPADYGIVYLFNSIMMFFVPLIGLQSETYFSRYYFEIKKEVFAEHVGGIFKVVAITTAAAFFFLYLLNDQLSSALAVEKGLMGLCLIASFFTIVGAYLLQYFQMENSAGKYISVIIIITLINLILSLLLVVVFRFGWQGRIIGIMVSVFIQAIVSVYILYRNGFIKFKINMKYTGEIVAFGFPLLLGAMGGWVINLADKVFIAKMVSLSATGIYGIGSSMGMIMALIVNSFGRAWFPYFLENIKDNIYENNVRIVKLTYLFTSVIILLAFVVTFFSYVFIKYFIATEYFESYKYVLWISLGQGIAGINSIFLYYLLYEKKNYLISGIFCLSAVSNLFLNFFLIKLFGTIGAAYAVFVSFLIAAIITILFSVHYHKMPWLYFLKRGDSSFA
jgi:O-antigen/teichoic acid export membrane protein